MLLLSIMGIVSIFCVVITGSVFSDISVVITFHFVVEDLCFCLDSFLLQLVIDQLKNLVAIFVEFFLDFLFVTLEEMEVL